MRVNDRLLVSVAYLFGIPALYIVLTDSRRTGYIGYHGSQAFMLWVLFFIIFFMARFFIDLVWNMEFIPGLEIIEQVLVLLMGTYAIFCGFRSFRGKSFRIPR